MNPAKQQPSHGVFKISEHESCRDITAESFSHVRISIVKSNGLNLSIHGNHLTIQPGNTPVPETRCPYLQAKKIAKEYVRAVLDGFNAMGAARRKQ
jgi:hypothetical protein